MPANISSSSWKPMLNCTCCCTREQDRRRGRPGAPPQRPHEEDRPGRRRCPTTRPGRGCRTPPAWPCRCGCAAAARPRRRCTTSEMTMIQRSLRRRRDRARRRCPAGCCSRRTARSCSPNSSWKRLRAARLRPIDTIIIATQAHARGRGAAATGRGRASAPVSGADERWRGSSPGRGGCRGRR